jgi:hypothetical protein
VTFGLTLGVSGWSPDETAAAFLYQPVVAFLQGKKPEIAAPLIQPGVLRQGPQFQGRQKFARSVSTTDRAKQWATFFLEDLADLVQATITPYFALSRYAEHIGRSASSFDQIVTALEGPPSLTADFLGQ